MIRPLQINDVFLIQRLGRQATKLNIIQALLQPRNAFWAMFTSALPWNDARVTTYILDEKNTTKHVGFIQSRKRSGRPESDLLLLAPALDQPLGHPSIWEKLIAYQVQKAIDQQIARIYVDVRDQPLPISILAEAGFTRYSRQTVWRLSKPTEFSASDPKDEAVFAAIRPRTIEDEWALRRLYTQVTPLPIQKAEGNQAGEGHKLPISEWWYPGTYRSFVLGEKNSILGCIQIAYTNQGIWLQLWGNSHDPNTEPIHLLIRFALCYVQKKLGLAGPEIFNPQSTELPIYISVAAHQGGLDSILAEHGFAPFIDRASMVRHILQRVQVSQPSLLPALEPVPSFSLAPSLPEARLEAGTVQ